MQVQASGETPSDVLLDRIAVGGDSAGGNLAAVVAQQRPIPIVFQLLVYPGCDMRMLTESMKKYAEGFGLTQKMCVWFTDHYLGVGASKTDPRASPMLADKPVLLGLPPACVIIAECDVLRTECEQYVGTLQSNLIESNLPVLPVLRHRRCAVLRFATYI